MDKKSSSLIDEKDVRGILKAIKKNWYFFIVFIGAAFVIAKVYIHKIESVYAAEVSIILDEEKKEDLRTAILYDLGVNTSYQNINNEMRKMQSSPIIQKTLKRLNFTVSYFIEGRLKTTEVYNGLPFEVKGGIKNNKNENIKTG